MNGRDGPETILASDPIHGVNGNPGRGEHLDSHELSSFVEIEDHVRLGFNRRTVPRFSQPSGRVQVGVLGAALSIPDLEEDAGPPIGDGFGGPSLPLPHARKEERSFPVAGVPPRKGSQLQ